MKNTKLAAAFIAVSLLGGSFAAQAKGNGQENVQNTQGYQNFIHSQSTAGSVTSDNSVFQNHDSNS